MLRLHMLTRVKQQGEARVSVWAEASSQVLARVSTDSVSLIKLVLTMLLRQPLNGEHVSQESDVICVPAVGGALRSADQARCRADSDGQPAG